MSYPAVLLTTTATQGLQLEVVHRRQLGSQLTAQRPAITSLYSITAGGSNAEVLLGRSVITNNTFGGITNVTSPSTFYSYGNNQINLNGGGDISGALNTAFTPR